MRVESRELLRLVKSALDAVESPQVRPSSLVRRAIRIANARRDYQQVIRFGFETARIVRQDKLPLDNAVSLAHQALVSLIGDTAAGVAVLDAYEEFVACRSLPADGPNKGQISAFEITRIEENVDLLEALLEDLRKPGHAASFEKTLTNLFEQRAILTRVRKACFDYFLRVENELERGQEESSVLQRGKEYVDATLGKESPGTLRRLKTAERRLNSSESGPEDLSLALTCCRRTLHSLADFLYPANGAQITGLDGTKRKMTDDKYMNRILQFVREKLGEHKQGAVLQQAIDELGTRLGGLNSLSSKGVHSDVTRDEAESCVMWTYMVVADVLRIWDGSRSGDQPGTVQVPEPAKT